VPAPLPVQALVIGHTYNDGGIRLGDPGDFKQPCLEFPNILKHTKRQNYVESMIRIRQVLQPCDRKVPLRLSGSVPRLSDHCRAAVNPVTLEPVVIETIQQDARTTSNVQQPTAGNSLQANK
jgi:hypothetical protein